MQIGTRALGAGQPTYIIAEVSANHEGDYHRAEALVYAAAMAGADAVKFQTFTAQEIAAAGIRVPRGQDPATDRWLAELGVAELRDLFRHGGLPRPWHRPLQSLAVELGLDFLSTPFSVDAARFLVGEVGVPALKIASGDLNFWPLLDYADGQALPVLLSTGGATRAEVWEAVGRHLGRIYDRGDLALLHCVSHYPASLHELNLAVIPQWRQEFPGAVVGWSDHTLSVEMVPALAVSLGAEVVEKHLAWERAGGRVDAGHSLTANEFGVMVQAIRGVPAMTGSPTKAPTPAEAHDRLWARRSPGDWKRPTEEARQGRWTSSHSLGEDH